MITKQLVLESNLGYGFSVVLFVELGELRPPTEVFPLLAHSGAARWPPVIAHRFVRGS